MRVTWPTFKMERLHHKISQSKVWDYRLRRDRGPMIDMISRYHIGGLDLQYYLA